jgi:hypothetical protein
MGANSEVDRRRDNHDREPDHFIVVRNWHTLLIVLSIIVSAVLAFGSLHDDSVEYRRRIESLENRPQVSQESIDNLNKRLERIEKRWDAEDLEKFRQMGEPGLKRQKITRPDELLRDRKVSHATVGSL